MNEHVVKMIKEIIGHKVFKFENNPDGSIKVYEDEDRYLKIFKRDNRDVVEFYAPNEIHIRSTNNLVKMNTKTRVFSTEESGLIYRVVRDGLNYSLGQINKSNDNNPLLKLDVDCFSPELVARHLVTALTNSYYASFKIDDLTVEVVHGMPEIHVTLSHTVKSKRNRKFTSEVLITSEGNAYMNGILIGYMFDTDQSVALDGHFEKVSILDNYRHSDVYDIGVDVKIHNNSDLVIDARKGIITNILKYMIDCTGCDYFNSITIKNWSPIMNNFRGVSGIKNLSLTTSKPFDVDDIKELTNLVNLYIKCEWIEKPYHCEEFLAVMKNMKKLKTLVVHTTAVVAHNVGNTASLLYKLKKELPNCRIILYGETIPKSELYYFTTDKYEEPSDRIEFHFTNYLHGAFAMDENTDLSIKHTYNITDDIHIPVLPTKIHGLNVVGNKLITINSSVLKNVSCGVYMKAENIDIYGDLSKIGSKKCFTIEGNTNITHGCTWNVFKDIEESLKLNCDLNLYGDMNVLNKGLKRLEATQISTSYIDLTDFKELEHINVVNTKITGSLIVKNKMVGITIGDNCDINELQLEEIKGESGLLYIKINVDAHDIKFNEFLNHVRSNKDFNCTTVFTDEELLISINTIK